MEKIFKEQTVQVPAGTKFSCEGPCPDWETELIVDENGDPTYASYGSSDGWGSVSSKSESFDDAVRAVMNTLIEEDLSEFKAMRDCLNSKYRQMAEEIRIEMMNKYNF